MKIATVTEEHIEAIFDASTYDESKIGDKTTVVCLKLPNGFEITETSSCVDPANYNHRLGVELALVRAKARLWELEGYVLQTKLAEGGA